MADSKRVKEVKKRAKPVFDKILEVYETRDFVEIVGRIGGDTVTRRYYNNGLVTER